MERIGINRCIARMNGCNKSRIHAVELCCYNMASIKSSKISLPKIFQLELSPGWLLNIDTNVVPTQYTLVHGKKSMNFDTTVASDLCRRNYSIRLAMGRRQMVIPPEVLQAFSDHEIFLQWYDTSLQGQGC